MKYSTALITLFANSAFSFVLPDTQQFFSSSGSANSHDFSSLEDKFERKVDQLAQILHHVEEIEKAATVKAQETTLDFSRNEYAAAFGRSDDEYREHRGSRERERERERYDYPIGRDDTDPRDGTDPGDGPPYYRSPKEPPHHTPSAPDNIPHVPRPRMPPRDRTGPHKDKTLWQVISECKHTSRFHDYLKDDREIQKMLDDEKANLTVFAPSNDAFRRFEEYSKHHKLSKDMIHRVLMYHLSPGFHSSQDLRYHNTLVTMLSEKDLGKGMNQRVRIGLGYSGPSVNFYSQFTMVDLYCKNGVIHDVDELLIPPPDVDELIEALPTEFSTSTHALERTGIIKDLPKYRGHGLTVFVPSNRDWQKLGFRLNAFLFSDCGKPYLRALMKYHISPGYTLYSDALEIPDKKGRDTDSQKEKENDPNAFDEGYTHAWMPTLLEDEHLSVDITRLERFMSFRVNGLTSIITSDGVARSGSVQVPDHIIMPRGRGWKQHRSGRNDEDEEMDESQAESYGGYTIADLKNALEPYVQKERMELQQLENQNMGEL
jgi:uncharacterized surface protein with fasciclin (FAS1) repeats